MSALPGNNYARPPATTLIARFFGAFFIVLVVELTADRILPMMLPNESSFARDVADSIIILAVSVPCFWWLIYRPLRVSPLVWQAQQELQKSEARFRNLADFAPVGIFETDAVGDCIFVNRKWSEIAGLSREQALGRGWVAALHPEDAMLVEKEWYQTVSEEKVFMNEYRFRTPEGADTFVLGSAIALKGEDGAVYGFMGVILDITEQKRIYMELLESEDRFHNIFEQSEDAIILFAPGTSTIIDANETAERLYGYSKKELISHYFNVFKSMSEYRGFMHSVCMLRGEDICRLDDIVNIKNDGTEIHLSVWAKVIRLQGLDAIYCTLRDISQRLRMEEVARSIQAQMIHSNKMASLGLLVAGIAHEINNPNNYIMGNAQMLYKIWEDISPLLKEKARINGDFILGGLPYSKLESSLPEMITAINDGSRRIKNIVAGLKSYSRRGKAAMESLAINNVVDATMLLLKHHVEKYTDNFVIELEDGIPLVRGSSQQLEQVVINLIMNALQSLTDRKQRITLKTSFSSEKRTVLVTIADEGCGISEGIRGKIMQPFFTTRLDSGGTGLGLSISRSIILAHQGRIDVASQPGEGTVVTVSLPVAE